MQQEIWIWIAQYRKTSYDLACQSIVLLKNNNVCPSLANIGK